MKPSLTHIFMQVINFHEGKSQLTNFSRRKHIGSVLHLGPLLECFMVIIDFIVSSCEINSRLKMVLLRQGDTTRDEV